MESGLPFEQTHLNIQSVNDFIKSIKEDSYQHFELGLMLHGEQGTGKSTIARFLVGMRSTLFQMPTDGTDIYSGLSFFDDEKNIWLSGKQAFTLEDIIVSRTMQVLNNPEHLDNRAKMEMTERERLENIETTDDISDKQGLASQSSRKNKQIAKEIITLDNCLAETNLRQVQTPLQDKDIFNINQAQTPHQDKDILNIKQAQTPHQDKDILNVKQPQTPHQDKDFLNVKQTQTPHQDKAILNLKQASTPHQVKGSETAKNSGIIGKLKDFFGIKKEDQEIQISVTKSELYEQSRKVAKKEFYNSKIVPVIIWDSGGRDVSTHQSLMPYRAVYMLVLDGSRTLNEPCKHDYFLPGKDGAKTQKDYVRFWINTIITYCKGENPGFPKIMVILTHKDKLKETEIENRKGEIFGEIEKMFDGSPIKQHLAIEDRIFVNARNNNDPEMEKIKHSLILLAKIQPTWGEKLPKCFLPLELEIQCLFKNGNALITIDDIKKINYQHGVWPLTHYELKTFLKFQHSVGRILYFDEPFLDKIIIISPTFLIDAFKSIITDKQLYNGDTPTEETWYLMNKTGIILKQAIFTLWKHKYTHFVRSIEYLLGIMTRCDMLVEPMRYDKQYHHRIPVEFFYVPIIVRKQDTTGYLQSPTFSQRNIAISFDIIDLVIPPGVFFRFISYCLSIWSVKTYGDDNEDMLFHRSAVFTIDPCLDLYIQCEDDRLIVRLVHARSHTLIVREIASGIRECLFAALHKISKHYLNSSRGNTRNIWLFKVNVCCSSSKDTCSVTFTDIGDVWICSGHQIEHGKDMVLSWFTEQGKERCESLCPVTNPIFLEQTPTELHLRRLAIVFPMYEIQLLVIALGLPYRELEEIFELYEDEKTGKFRALMKCFQMKHFTFKNLKDAAKEANSQNPHTLCKVVRDDHINFEREPEKWDLVVTNEDMDKISPLIGRQSLNFLIELGMTFLHWEQIEYSQRERDCVKLNRKILEVWRTNCKSHNIKPTLRIVGQALENIGIHIRNTENLLFS